MSILKTFRKNAKIFGLSTTFSSVIASAALAGTSVISYVPVSYTPAAVPEVSTVGAVAAVAAVLAVVLVFYERRKARS